MSATVGLGNGYWETVQADGDGYFYLTVRGYDNHYQTYDAVEHPETREVIFVTPYPWTGWEHENAEW